MRKGASSLYVGVSFLQRLCKKHFLDAKLSIGGRISKLTNRMEMSGVRNLTGGEMSIAREAIK